ncbi:hypothetical protein ACMGDM_09105 [Sphingomonas sp. DT-51]|uniref:hypothetical protein n=1 Tax=Sphingomonas sp. DT-51 TaxID=3396165 RepID=UPI003F1D9ED2
MAYPFLFAALLLAEPVNPVLSPLPQPAETSARASRALPACRPLGLAQGVTPATSVLATRANVIQADIVTARKMQRLTQQQADALWQETDQVRARVAGKARLPVGTRAEAARALDSVAARLCHG